MSLQTSTLTPPKSDQPAGQDTVRPPRSRTATRTRRWARPALLGLLAATALLYLWGLGASGWANSFYSAAAQAGSDSWKAFFFGASDAAGSITVDKPPMALWFMALSVKLFGLSSWSILVPEALMGVASVALLHATVRRTTRSAAAGLIAGAVLALTPVAVLMFKFNNPDALLVLLLIGAVASTVRALESSRLRAEGVGAHPVRWLALGGALVGFAFLTKMLQAFLVLPALALVYLLCAHTPIGKRIGHLLVAFGTMVLAAGWWIAIVELWPASSRPYIGGSQDNSILELTLGYNGLGRITGNEVGSVGGGGGGTGTGMWGETGLLRMFSSEIGGQIAWLLPASLILLVAGLWFTRRAARTDLVRAGLVVWGTWLLVTALCFSFMAGIFHAYYTVALAPAIGALVGIGATQLWQRRDDVRRRPGPVGHHRVHHRVRLRAPRPDQRLPALAQVGRRRRRRRGRPAPGRRPAPAARHRPRRGRRGPGRRPGRPHGVRRHHRRQRAHRLDPDRRPEQRRDGRPRRHRRHAAAARGGMRGTPPGAPTQGGATTGGLLEGSQSSAAITALLQTDADSYTWAAAAIGSNSAAGYQLASEESVMPIGGFNGSDPSPTLAQFKAYVADGDIHYFIASGGDGGGRGGMNASGSTSTEISTWVAARFTATTVDGVTLYDLSGGVQ